MRRDYFVYVLVFVMTQCVCASCFAESAAQDEVISKRVNPSDSSNIGFMNNPPKEYTDRFPMCDVFLDVKWIDKKKMIGYSQYEAIRKTKDGKFKGRKMMWALVALDSTIPRIDYDVYQYKKQGRLEEIFDAVRNGKVSIGIPMMIDYKGKSINLYAGKAINHTAIHPLLGDHEKTVCVPYPDGQVAWVIEGKSVAGNYSKGQIDALTEKIDDLLGKHVHQNFVKNLWLLDINFDDTEDYFFKTFVMYSGVGGFYVWEKSFKYPNHIFLVPTSSKRCQVKDLNGYSITTDGVNYFFEKKCNLTELISTSGAE